MFSIESLKNQARRLSTAMADRGATLGYRDALDTIARVHGHRHWKEMSAVVLVTNHLADLPGQADAPEVGTLDIPGVGAYGQRSIPGTGFLYRVPVTVDATLTGIAAVRAMSREGAIELARRLAANGELRMEVDDGNYRGACDYYCPDSSSDSVYRVAEPVDQHVSETESGVQVGAYLVEVQDVDQSTLCVDVTILEPQVDEDDEPLTATVPSYLPLDATHQERMALCRLVASQLHERLPVTQLEDTPGESTADMAAVSQVLTRCAREPYSAQVEQELNRISAR